MIPLDRVRAMLAAATPGPWRREREDGTIGSSVVADAHDDQVADATGQAPARDPARRPVHEVQRANAALIAAAPDLAAQVLTLAAALETAQRERDAYRSAHAELAAAVRAEREALSAEWDAASEHHSEMWAETYYATKPPARAATARLTALLAAAPPRSTVPARVVQEYLAADDAHDDANTCATAATAREKRAALDAALAGCV